MLHGLSDETASIPLKLIDFLEEIRRQCDGDSLCGWHGNSMTQSMIILNVQTLAEAVWRRSLVTKASIHQGADKDSLAFQMTRENSHAPSDRRE